MPSARETLRSFLTPFDLGTADDVLDAVWKFAQENPNLVNNTDLLLNSARGTATYKERFKGNEARVKKGLPELLPSTYIKYEDAYRANLRQAGMPAGFYDDQVSLQSFIGNDVDPEELGARIQLGYQAVRNADPQVVAEFKRLYPVTDGDLAAYFIDPERARPTFDKYEAQRQARAAVVAAEAQRQATMTLTQQEAESLVRAGIETPEAARQGFGAIQQTQGLFEAQMAGEQAVSREEQIGAAFGTSAAAQQRVATRRRRRQAEFETGGSLAAGQQGVTGLRTVGQ